MGPWKGKWIKGKGTLQVHKFRWHLSRSKLFPSRAQHLLSLCWRYRRPAGKTRGICRNKTDGKSSCKGLSADVLHLRMLHNPEGSEAAELTAFESKAWFQYQLFYIKTSDSGSTETLLERKIHQAPHHETSTRTSPPLAREPVLGHFHCVTGVTLDLEQRKNKAYQAGETSATSSFSEMRPILQQITGFAVSSKAKSRHPSSCRIWPRDSAYICMPSKDSCQYLMPSCLFLSELKPVRTSSSKIRVQLSFKRCGGDQGRLEVNWSMTRRKVSKERGMELFYFWSWEGKTCSLSSCVKRIFKKLSGRKKLMKANWKSLGYLSRLWCEDRKEEGDCPGKEN